MRCKRCITRKLTFPLPNSIYEVVAKHARSETPSTVVNRRGRKNRTKKRKKKNLLHCPPQQYTYLQAWDTLYSNVSWPDPYFALSTRGRHGKKKERKRENEKKGGTYFPTRHNEIQERNQRNTSFWIVRANSKGAWFIRTLLIGGNTQANKQQLFTDFYSPPTTNHVFLV